MFESNRAFIFWNSSSVNIPCCFSQPVVKKVSVKDPPSKVQKDPPRKRFVKRCGFNRFGKRVCRWVPVRGPGPRPGTRTPF
jgi:hypothetical protein